MPTDLTCPECQGSMRNYERNGIHIDQCSECTGIFLDRGELEHLISAEAAYSQTATESQAVSNRLGGATPPPGPQPARTAGTKEDSRDPPRTAGSMASGGRASSVSFLINTLASRLR